MRATTSRLAVANRRQPNAQAFWRAMRAHDIDAIIEVLFGPACVRRSSTDSAATRSTAAPSSGRHSSEYSSSTASSRSACWRFAVSVSNSLRSRWSDDSGNETDLPARERESTTTGCIDLRGPLRRGRLRRRLPRTRSALLRRRRRGIRRSGRHGDRVRDRPSTGATSTGYSASSVPPTSASRTGRGQSFRDRSAAEFRASLEELDAMVTSARTWNSAMCWLSPTLPSPASNAKPSDATASDTRGPDLRRRDPRRTTRVDMRVRSRRRGGGVRLRRGTGAGGREQAGGHEPVQASRRTPSGDAHGRPRRRRRRRLLSRTHTSTTIVDGSAVIPFADSRRIATCASSESCEQYSHFEWRTLAVRGERLSSALEPMVRTTPGTRRPTCTCSKSAMTG